MVLPSGLTAMPSGSTPVGISRDHLARRHVDHRHHVVVLVRHIQRIARDVQRECLGIRAGRQRADDLQRLGVDDLDGVVVAGADQDVFAVLGQRDAARPLADRTVLTVFIWSRSTTLMVLSRSFDT